MARPNLYYSSCEVDMSTIKKAQWDVFKYIEYLENAIKFQEQETYRVKVSRVKTKTNKKQKGKSSIQHKMENMDRLLFEVLDPSTYEHKNSSDRKKVEKGIELLFNDKTEHIFKNKKGFRSEEGITILSKNSNLKRIELAEKIEENNYIFLRPDTYQLKMQKKALQYKDGYLHQAHQRF